MSSDEIRVLCPNCNSDITDNTPDENFRHLSGECSEELDNCVTM